MYNWERGGVDSVIKKVLSFWKPCRTSKTEQLYAQLMTCKSFIFIDLAVTVWRDLFPREGNLPLLSGFCLEWESAQWWWTPRQGQSPFQTGGGGCGHMFAKTPLTVCLLRMACSGHYILKVWGHEWAVSKETFCTVFFPPLLDFL